MSLKQNDHYYESVKDATESEQVDMKEKYPGKKLCKECASNYHPDKFSMCWNCWSKQPARITQYKK